MNNVPAKCGSELLAGYWLATADAWMSLHQTCRESQTSFPPLKKVLWERLALVLFIYFVEGDLVYS